MSLNLNPSLLRASFAISSIFLGGALLVSGCGGGSSGPTPNPTATTNPNATSTPVPTTAPVGTFADEFNANSLDNSKWLVSDSSSKIQRTQFGNQPTFGTDADGTKYMRVPLSTYLPTGTTSTLQLYGSEVYAKQKVARGNGVVFEARMRLSNPQQKGIVASFFMLGQKGDYGVPANPLTIDEIDHEILTNGIAENSPYTWTNSYNNFILEQPNVVGDRYDNNPTKTIGLAEPIIAGFNAGNWNVYRVEWKAGQVRWLINNQVIRTETSQVVPDDDLGVRFNIWGAADAPVGWQAAFDASLAPTTAAENKTYGLDIDWVHVNPLTANTTGALTSASGLQLSPITSADRAHAGGAGYRSTKRR